MKNIRTNKLIPSFVMASALAATLFASSSASATIIVDTFDDISSPSVWPITLNTLGTVSVTENGLTGVLGGDRVTTLDVTSIGIPGLDNGQVTVAPSPAGVMDFSSSVAAAGSVTLSYAFGATDFSGQTGAEIDLLSFDNANLAGMDITVTMFSGTDSLTQTVSLTSAITSLTTIFLDASLFTGLGDFTAIDSIEVAFVGGLGTDFRVDEIRAIPGPGSFALIGLAGLVASRRRRK